MTIVMSEDEEIQHNLQLAEDFADANERFDRTFIESLRQYYDAYGDLSQNQQRALRNVICKWHMEEWRERNGGVA